MVTKSLASITALTLLGSETARAVEDSPDPIVTPVEDNPYMQYSATDSFSAQRDYSRYINTPLECFGNDLEVFEQL